MLRYLCAGVFMTLLAGTAFAGVINPNISIIGQPSLSLTDDPEDPDANRARFDAGETEIVFDDYLNPYARGFFTLTLAEEGLELEEGFFTLFRGLPGQVALRGGKYRAPFGRLNPVHPHAYPFAESFAVIQAYLPGEEAYIETGVDLSRRFPIAGEFSLNAQADWFQGNTFRRGREPSEDAGDPLNESGDDASEQTRPAFLGRLSGFTMLGERSALEFGASATRGTNNVAARTRTSILGIDAKAKLWCSVNAYLLLQAEGFRLEREEAGWESGMGYTKETVNAAGGYVYADYNFGIRYNLGASFERFQEPEPEKPWTRVFGAFAGLALLEETTAIRLDWRNTKPDGGDAANGITLRVIYSMGPHKAHQF